jgi:hypothetical protein
MEEPTEQYPQTPFIRAEAEDQNNYM